MNNMGTNSILKPGHQEEGAVYLLNADKLVKRGEYEEALAEIKKARESNPKNLYALAYEEHVRSILLSQKEAQSQKIIPQNDDLEKISERAIIEAQRKKEAEIEHRKRIAEIEKEELESRKQEEQQRAAIRKKVDDLFQKAREYYAEKDYERALDEIARIYIIDPSNLESSELESQIRSDREKSIREAEEIRLKRQQEEENKRKEILKAELDRIKREDEDRRRKEEEKRLAIQKEKVRQHLNRARKFCEEGNIQEARSEIAFVVIIDPLHEEIAELEQRLQEIEQEQRKVELERLNQKKQEQEKLRREKNEKVQKHINNAQQYLRQNKFSEAIRVISSAYVLDPLNSEIEKWEKKIFKARDQYLRLEEEKKQIQAEEENKKQELEMRKVIKIAQERALAHEGKLKQDERNIINEKISQYLGQARLFIKNNEFESALGQIALAFVIDPFNQEIAEIEQEIIDIQSARRVEENQQNNIEQVSLTGENTTNNNELSDESDRMSDNNPEDNETFIETIVTEDDRVKQIAVHIAEARRLRKMNEYNKARDALTKAFMLDPLSEEIKAFEEELQGEYHKQQQELKKLKAIRNYADRAKVYLHQEDFERALQELEIGMKLHPDNQELIELKSRIEESKKRWQEVEDLWEKTALAERQARSGRVDTKNKYKEALANYYTAMSETESKKIVRRSGKAVKSASVVIAEKQQHDMRKQENKGVVDLESEIREIYTTWQEEQDAIELGTREKAIQNHITEAKRLLAIEAFDDALAEVAYAKMIDRDRPELTELELEIWNKWDEVSVMSAQKYPELISDGGSGDDSSGTERNVSIRIHLREADKLIEQKEYTKALDEITKAYLVDLFNNDIIRLEDRIRRLQGVGASSSPLKMVYPTAQAV